MASPKAVEKDIREVLDYEPTGEMITTVYLSVDNAIVLKQDYLTKLNSMIAEARSGMEKNKDIEKNHKKSINDRSTTK